MKSKEIKAKTLRALGITKPIPLTYQEVRWIKLIKGHYDKDYKYDGVEWTDLLKPMFNEVYGWTAEEFYQDFLACMFTKLMDIHLKIKEDQSGHNGQLYSIFSAAFFKSVSREQEQPIERAISEVCALIQNTIVFKDGVYRFYLNTEKLCKQQL